MASACGVSHMLKSMQRTPLQIYMKAEFAKSVGGVGSVAENGMEGRTGLRPGWFNQKTSSLKVYRSAERHEDLCLSWGRAKDYVDIVMNKETRVLAFRNRKGLRFSGRCSIANVRTSNRRLVGRMGATASVTNSTASEHGDNAPAPKKVDAPEPVQLAMEQIKLLEGWKPPRYLWRSVACIILAGQVFLRIIQGKVHMKNSIQQLKIVGPESLGVSLLTASFVGMVFTIQFVREFARLGLTRSVGGVLALALARELSPVVTAIILAGRVGSAFAAELGTMQVSEQTDTLRVLRTDPIDYLVTPRVIACCVSLPILTIICFSVAMGASVLLADSVYNVSSNIILESAARALQPWDLISTSIKSVVFGGIISIISCTWGVTTLGGAKGVGESTTSAVVISLVCIFIADFVLSWLFFQGAGDALKAAMG